MTNTEDQARKNLMALLSSTSTPKKALSLNVGRGPTYIFDYLSKRNPGFLPENNRKAIAAYFGIDDVFLSMDALPLDISNIPQQDQINNVALVRSSTPPDLLQIISDNLPVFELIESGEGDFLNVASKHMTKRPLKWANNTEVYAIIVSGESMIPRYFPGEIAYIDPGINNLSNRDVVIYFGNREGDNGVCRILLKQYVKKTPKNYVLASYNPDYERHIEIPIEQVKQIHAVTSAHEILSNERYRM